VVLAQLLSLAAQAKVLSEGVASFLAESCRMKNDKMRDEHVTLR
jgi:hypothetical protein